MKKLLITGITLLLTTGCSNKREVYQPQSSNSAEIQIAQAAEVISNSLIELSAIEKQALPHHKKNDFVNPNAKGMQETASIDWSGPIGPVVEHIAKASNYKVRVLGKEPTLPIIITINSKNMPLAHILRDIHYQAKEQADIRVYQKNKIIELRYAKY